MNYKKTITIKIQNWGKHQPRKDYKRPHWFALQNDFPLDPKLADFTNDEKLCLVYLFCEASRQNKQGKIELFVDHWCRLNLMTPKILMQTLEKIESVQIAYRVRTESELHITEQYITIQNNTEQNSSTTPESVQISGRGKAPSRSTEGSLIWEAYREAYRGRYGVDPVRNATTNTQCANLAKRLGAAAVEVVKFYLTHNDGFYLKTQHPIGLCLNQAESLHTQWQRGVAVTSGQVRQFENQHTTKSAVEQALEIMSEREKQ
ncbi:MAG: hypothetical protein EB059_10885 [Alphaproteobacteria bacterium]|nr:hypothetical protein [Alphaproteobacteria bacterium]